MSRGPETYQQWMDCFARLEKQPWDKETLELVHQGGYAGKPSEHFLVRISDTVSVMLSKCTRKFLRELDQALADGEPDMAPLLAVRFRKTVRRSMFYRELEFLEAGYVQTLDEGFEKQLQAFWQDFLHQLKQSARDSMDPRMEDMALQLRRMKMTTGREAAENE